MSKFYLQSILLVELTNCRYSKVIYPLQLTEEKEKSSVDEVFPGHFKFFLLECRDASLEYGLVDFAHSFTFNYRLPHFPGLGFAQNCYYVTRSCQFNLYPTLSLKLSLTGEDTTHAFCPHNVHKQARNCAALISQWFPSNFIPIVYF